MAGIDALLHDVLRDDDLRLEFQTNPDALLAEYDLSEEEKEVLRSGDETELENLLADSDKITFADSDKMKFSSSDKITFADSDKMKFSSSDKMKFISSD